MWIAPLMALQLLWLPVLCQKQGPCTLHANKLRCTAEGYFELVQCNADYCACVDARDGTEARHTRTASPRVSPQCGGCLRELAHLVKKEHTWFPSCNPKNGEYKREQCLKEDFCYCVDPKNGRRIGREVKRSDQINCSPYLDKDDDLMFRPTNQLQEEAPLASPVCKLAKDNGTRCAAAPSIRYYFDAETFECLAFKYNGCSGNDNNFDTASECFHSCKLMDFFACSGNRRSARDKNGDRVVCGQTMQPIAPSKCPAGYRCLNGPFMGICCDAKNEDEFNNNYNPICRRGKLVEVDSGGGLNSTLLGKSCSDRFCPDRAQCVQLQHFAHCCL